MFLSQVDDNYNRLTFSAFNNHSYIPLFTIRNIVNMNCRKYV